MNPTPEQSRAIQALVACIEEVVDEFGPTPSGIVFASMQQYGITLSTYQSLLEAMERLGRIRVVGNIIFRP